MSIRFIVTFLLFDILDNTGCKRKRQLTFGDDDLLDDEEGFDQDQLVMDAYNIADKTKKSKASANEIWNSTHINLVRDLEKRAPIKDMV